LDCKLYKEKICFQLQNNDVFKFDVFVNNGFSKNFNVNELSDISFNKGIFPESIMNYTSVINNFAGYAIGDFIFIGMNYQNNVTSYDINILKALTISFDLTDTIRHQVNEIEEAFVYTTDALARAAEVNDDITGHHIKRVNFLASSLAKELNMSEEFISKIENAAQMHDVGKIFIDKAILTKPGKLTEEEFEHIKNHTVYGEKIIGKSEYLKMSSEIARSHHEKYDGSGYPDGIKGEEIPISARIVFLADIYDALRSNRPYKPGFSHQVSYDIITKGDGRVNPEHFDPNILHAFQRIHLEFEKIYNDLKD
jgi:HD-GYP domain-containing protein (c-di-GMP phosphodiesterase class II)